MAYVDESFDKLEYWVTGLVVPCSAAVELETRLHAVVASASASFPVSPDAELHGYELAHGEASWSGMAQMLRARLGIYERALEAIHETKGVRCFIYGLNRERHRRKYINPFPERQVLLGHVAQRAHGLCSKSDPLLLIADDNEQKDAIRDHITRFRREGTLSRVNSRPLVNIADTVYFAPSNRSRLIQAADLVSYIHFRQRRSVDVDPRALAAAQRLWRVVGPICDANMWSQS